MTSWTTKPVPRLALEAGGQLEKLYFTCFHYPTMVAHPTQVGLLSRLDTKQEPPRFKSEMQRTEVDHALSGAHAVVIQIADTHNRHFALGFKDRINSCSSDYLEIWKRKPTQAPNL
jgi:hypothetical protein